MLIFVAHATNLTTSQVNKVPDGDSELIIAQLREQICKMEVMALRNACECAQSNGGCINDWLGEGVAWCSDARLSA